MTPTERINEVIEFLRRDKALGTHFQMAGFSFNATGDADDYCAGEVPGLDYYAHCKTACCIAGWINVLEAQRSQPEKLTTQGRYRDFVQDSYHPAALLGLTEVQRGELFFMNKNHGTDSVMELEHFDDDHYVPVAMRYDAGIRVLEILRDENVVDWERALIESGFDFARYREEVHGE